MRAARLIQIVLLLQTRGHATAGELARDLEVSVRTIYRDVAALGAAGVPVYGVRGDGGGYRLVGGYRTSLTGLTTDETGALLLSGAAAPVVGELGIGSLLAATRLKLLAAVPPGMRGVAMRAEQRFHLDPGGWAHVRPRQQLHLQTVARAVWEDPGAPPAVPPRRRRARAAHGAPARSGAQDRRLVPGRCPPPRAACLPRRPHHAGRRA